MPDEDAKQLAGRAATQAKNAAKNSGRAVEAVAEETVEEVQETAHAVTSKVRAIGPETLTQVALDLGFGSVALGVSIFSGTVAYSMFRSAIKGRK